MSVDPIKNALPQNHLEGQCVLVDDIGLENHAETRGKTSVVQKLTPNPTLSNSEQRLLNLFSQLTEHDQRRLIEEIKDLLDQSQHNHETSGK